MLDDSMDKIRSDAALMGWLDRSADAVLNRARAAVDTDYLERSRALSVEVAALESQLDRLQARSAAMRKHLAVLVTEKNLAAPFEWILGRVQLAYLARNMGKIEETLGKATGELEQLREWSTARIAEMEAEIQLAYEQGQSLRELSGGIVRSKKNRFIRGETYDEI